MPAGVVYFNHYNPLDWALANDNWQRDQRLKPDNRYNYGWSILSPPSLYRYQKKETATDNAYSITLECPDDRHEIFSYAARSWGYALGQQGDTRGVFMAPDAWDVRELLVYDGKPQTHKYHSGQFRSSIQKRWGYWNMALKQFDTTQ